MAPPNRHGNKHGNTDKKPLAPAAATIKRASSAVAPAAPDVGAPSPAGRFLQRTDVDCRGIEDQGCLVMEQGFVRADADQSVEESLQGAHFVLP